MTPESAGARAHDPRIVVALDFPSADQALAMAGRIDPAGCRVKVGMELFNAAVPAVLKRLRRFGFDDFLDPNTLRHSDLRVCGSVES